MSVKDYGKKPYVDVLGYPEFIRTTTARQVWNRVTVAFPNLAEFNLNKRKLSRREIAVVRYIKQSELKRPYEDANSYQAMENKWEGLPGLDFPDRNLPLTDLPWNMQYPEIELPGDWILYAFTEDKYCLGLDTLIQVNGTHPIYDLRFQWPGFLDPGTSFEVVSGLGTPTVFIILTVDVAETMLIRMEAYEEAFDAPALPSSQGRGWTDFTVYEDSDCPFIVYTYDEKVGGGAQLQTNSVAALSCWWWPPGRWSGIPYTGDRNSYPTYPSGYYPAPPYSLADGSLCFSIGPNNYYGPTQDGGKRLLTSSFNVASLQKKVVLIGSHQNFSPVAEQGANRRLYMYAKTSSASGGDFDDDTHILAYSYMNLLGNKRHRFQNFLLGSFEEPVGGSIEYALENNIDNAENNCMLPATRCLSTTAASHYTAYSRLTRLVLDDTDDFADRDATAEPGVYPGAAGAGDWKNGLITNFNVPEEDDYLIMAGCTAAASGVGIGGGGGKMTECRLLIGGAPVAGSQCTQYRINAYNNKAGDYHMYSFFKVSHLTAGVKEFRLQFRRPVGAIGSIFCLHPTICVIRNRGFFTDISNNGATAYAPGTVDRLTETSANPDGTFLILMSNEYDNSAATPYTAPTATPGSVAVGPDPNITRQFIGPGGEDILNGLGYNFNAWFPWDQCAISIIRTYVSGNLDLTIRGASAFNFGMRNSRIVTFMLSPF